ncbi:MAG: hypothetical protein JNJ95_09745 [Dechloromonas sp.]|nr:hypothetical protein [Dechloromonas sp.]
MGQPPQTLNNLSRCFSQAIPCRVRNLAGWHGGWLAEQKMFERKIDRATPPDGWHDPLKTSLEGNSGHGGQDISWLVNQ